MTVHAPSDSYAQAALDRECETLALTASGRNEALNRAAFSLGQLVGAGHLARPSVESRLLEAVRANGYVSKDGEPAARATIRSGLDRGLQQPRSAPPDLHRPVGADRPQPQKRCVVQIADRDEADFPAWTKPNDKGRPKFFAVGKTDLELRASEVRRHLYRSGDQVVRIKVKLADGSFIDFYRVRRPSDGAIGWQARKPNGYLAVPYTGPVGSLDPFDPEHAGDPVFWPEGEKDVDTLAVAGALAFTFGGSSDVPEAAAALLAGRHIVILADNDEPGRRCTARKIEMAVPVAASVRQVAFGDLDPGEDVSDWLTERGGTVEALSGRAELVKAAQAQTSNTDPLLGFQFDGDALPDPPRYLVKHLVPAEGVTVLGGQSGAGKTFTLVALAVAGATGAPFFGRPIVEPFGTLILAAEGAGTLGARIEAARRTCGDGQKLPIAWLSAVPNLADPEEVRTLQPKIQAVDARMRAVHGVRLGLIGIDTLAAAFALKDENDAAEAQQTLRLMRMLGDPIGALVMPVHHYGKTEETGLRGSSAYRGGADAVLSVLADRNQVTGEVTERSLNLAKTRHGEEGPIASFALRFVELGTDADGEAFGACVVEPDLNAPPPSTRKRPVKDPLPIVALKDAFDEVLPSLGQDVRVMGDPGAPFVRAVTVEQLRPEFRRRYSTGNPDGEKAATAVRQALKRGLDASPKHGFRTAVWDGEEWLWKA